MQLQIQSCKGCNRTLPIINRKYFLCNNCNRQRLGTGGLKRPLKRSYIKKVSSKQNDINKKLKHVYATMSNTRERVCSGCGSKHNLSHSHIIPRSRRRDLICDIDNITYHCLTKNGDSGCHEIWENGSWETKQTLNDFTKLMNYIKNKDVEYYNLLLSRAQKEKS